MDPVAALATFLGAVCTAATVEGMHFPADADGAPYLDIYAYVADGTMVECRFWDGLGAEYILNFRAAEQLPLF